MGATQSDCMLRSRFTWVHFLQLECYTCYMCEIAFWWLWQTIIVKSLVLANHNIAFHLITISNSRLHFEAILVFTPTMVYPTLCHCRAVRHELMAALSTSTNHGFIRKVGVIGGVFLTNRRCARLEDRQQRRCSTVDFITFTRPTHGSRQESWDANMFTTMIRVSAYIQWRRIPRNVTSHQKRTSEPLKYSAPESRPVLSRQSQPSGNNVH